VFASFTIISSVYGDLVGSADITDDQVEQVHDLKERFDDGTFHDRGRIVHDKVTDSIGINLERRLEDDEDYPTHETLEEFHRKTGYRAQPCEWGSAYGDGKPRLVIVFVPYGRTADGERMIDLLWDMEVPKPARPTP
jgi:hypothetical protein